MAYHVKKTSERSRRDPSQGGWDTTIIKAPDSHTSKHGKRRHHRRRKKWPKVVAGVLIALLVIMGIGASAAFMYKKTIDEAMSLGDNHEAISAALTDTPASKPFYVLVMGSDLREVTDKSVKDGTNYSAAHGTRSDVIMLMRVDATNSKLTMMTIPRDTPYEYADGTIAKLNHTYETDGATGLIAAVEELTGFKISHYVEVHGSDVENVVDGLGGITVDVPQAISGTTITGTPVSIDAGLQRLSGSEALLLANQRMQYESFQDANRQKGARLVVAGIIDAIRSKPLLEIPGAVADAASCVKTDMETTELVNLVRMMQDNLTLYSGTAPYDGDLDLWAVSSHDEDDAPWLCYVNETGWKRVLATLDSGDDIAGLSYDNDAVHYAGQPENTWSQGLVEP